MGEKTLTPVGEEIVRMAETLFRQDPDWITFFREVLGVDGLIRKLIPSPAEVTEFEQTPEYAQIQDMLKRLREQSAEKPTFQEQSRMITIRLPRSVHEALQDEAHRRRTSMNKLCIAKLLQLVDGQTLSQL